MPLLVAFGYVTYRANTYTADTRTRIPWAALALQGSGGGPVVANAAGGVYGLLDTPRA